MTRSKPGQAGFTLLEILLALAILVVSIGSIHAVLQSGLAASTTTAERARALVVAESALALAVKRGTQETAEGSEEGIDWTVTVQSESNGDVGSNALRLLLFRSTARWNVRGRQESLTLETKRAVRSTDRGTNEQQ